MDYATRVRLDRYAIKNPDQKLQLNDLVVVSLTRVFEREKRTVESREIGHVIRLGETYNVKLDGNDEVVKDIPRHKLEYVVEKTYEAICDRVSAAVAKVETDDKQAAFSEQVKEAMLAERFVPAGRILSGLGRDDYDLTLFNCYVFALEGDSRAAISKHWARLFETFSRGGGVGWNLSILRPKGAIVKKVNGRSSGSVSWAEQFSQITGAVEQGGSRRGASWQGLEVWHPDTIEFIKAKAQREEIRIPDGQTISRNLNLISNANISVMITNDFMQAVQNNADWSFVFPDLDDPEYDKEWDGDIKRWQTMPDKKVVVYRTVRAREVWDLIIERAWAAGEPGLFFIDRAEEMSNSYYYSKISGANPCAEQSLPANSVCNLAHLNLNRYVHVNGWCFTERTGCGVDGNEATDYFNWTQFQNDIRMGVRFLDNVIDLNKYHDDDIETQQMSERRIGLGILGYGEMLIRLGLRYGSDYALKFTEHLMRVFSTTSYLASTALAAERGVFPAFKLAKFLKSGFMEQQDETVRAAIKQHGMRNVTVNTIAPTGSVATIMKTTGGCEPFFDLEYTSTTRIGIVKEKATIVEQLVTEFGTDREEWPEYVVTAQHGISPEAHVHTQACMQRWVDSSISKTINLPKDATVKDVADAYMLMWQLGCKGGTVYRDGSRDEQVLYVDAQVEVEVVEETPETALIAPRPDVGHSVTFSEQSPLGTVHLTMRHNPQDGEIVDFFVSVGKGDAAADAEAIGRLISMILRWPNNSNINQQIRLELIRDQLVDILGRGQVGFGPSAKRSLPDTIAKVIDKYLAGDFPTANLPFGLQQMKEIFDEIKFYGGDLEDIERLEKYVLYGETNGQTTQSVEDYKQEMEQTVAQAEADGMKLPYDLCPECGNGTLVIIPGKCPYCRTCGFSQC